MRLKNNCDIVAFLNAVQHCDGDVLLTTEEGDCLNLKSTLSRYVFAVIADNKKLMAQSTVECSEADFSVLREFIAQD